MTAAHADISVVAEVNDGVAAVSAIADLRPDVAIS